MENMAALHVSLPALRFLAAPRGGGAATDITAAVLDALRAALLVPGGAAEQLEDVSVTTQVFLPTGGGAAAMCSALGLPLLGSVPLDPLLGRAAEEGRSVLAVPLEGSSSGGDMVPGPAAAALQRIVERIVADLATGSRSV